MITDLRVRRRKHHCELYISALDITIYFYPGRALAIITDYAGLLQAFDMDAYTYVFDVIMPATIYDLLPLPIAEEIAPELWTRPRRVYEKLLSRRHDTINMNSFLGIDTDINFDDSDEFDIEPANNYGATEVDANINFNDNDEFDIEPADNYGVTKVDDKEDDYEPTYTILDFNPATLNASSAIMYTIDTKQYVKRRDIIPPRLTEYARWDYYSYRKGYNATSKFHRNYPHDRAICNCSDCRASNTRRDLPARYDDYPVVIKHTEYYPGAQMHREYDDMWD